MIRGLTVNAQTGEVVIARGDDQTIRFTITDSTGAAINVSAGSFAFTVKGSIDDTIGSALFQKQSPAGNGIDLAQAASGIVDVNIAAADTQAIAGVKVWDLQMTLSSKVRTLAGGTFRVAKDVTTPGVPPNPTLPLFEFPNAIAFDKEQYWKDQATGQWYKRYVSNGQEIWAGPSSSIPF